MSRIGKKPIAIPDGVKIAVNGNTVNTEGPVGKLSWTFRSELTVNVDAAAKTVTVGLKEETRMARSLHGLARSVISNILQVCAKGFEKSLEVYGVGYGVALQGPKLTLTVGLSHPVVFTVSPGLTVTVQANQARGDNEPAR